MFSKSYSAEHIYQSSKVTPYDDCKMHKKMDCIFTYFEHLESEDNIELYFLPNKNLAYINQSLEYYNFEVIAELQINDFNNTLGFNSIYCSYDDFWPGMYSNAPFPSKRAGTGGISVYKKHLFEFLEEPISLDFFINKFFGSSWSSLKLPLTLPKTSSILIDLANEIKCHNYNYSFKTYNTIGTFSPNRILAAITIQKYFRGWKARMKYRFNPNNQLGLYLELQEFQLLKN